MNGLPRLTIVPSPLCILYYSKIVIQYTGDQSNCEIEKYITVIQKVRQGGLSDKRGFVSYDTGTGESGAL